MAKRLGKIIIVDNDLNGSFALSSLLQSLGFDAVSVESVGGDEEGLFANLAGAGLVIMDTAIGDFMGLSSRIKVKQEDVGIIYTTVSISAEEELLRGVKSAKVFRKPFSLGLLLQTVNREVGTHH